MRKKILPLIFAAVMSLLMICFASSAAQNVDISTMDNAELMALLQAIMEKLEDSGSPIQLSADSRQQAEEIGNQDPDQLKIENGELKIGAADSVGRIFSIYENKKLMLERLPDYMFYQPPTEVPEEPQPGKTPTPKPKPDCFWTCWDDLGAYADCEWICMGEE